MAVAIFCMAPFFMPANISSFEIIHAPYFPLLGESFYASPGISRQNLTVKINSSGMAGFIQPNTDFSGSFENNLETPWIIR